METRDDNIREGLLSRIPQPANLPDYRREVAALLARNEKGLRREKIGAGALWFFCVALSTVFLYFGGRFADSTKGAYFGCWACFMLLFGAVELLKHFVNRSRVDVLKEVKQIQVQVLELHELLRSEPRP